MGAWGYGIFDDDTAMDAVDAMQYEENPYDFFADAFEDAITAEYLDYDKCHAVIISAAYMDAMLNGTQYVIEGSEDADYFNVFAKKHIALNVIDLKPFARHALQVVLFDKSELNELWAENEELYPLWSANVRELQERLL
jgi:hypothetical protein